MTAVPTVLDERFRMAAAASGSGSKPMRQSPRSETPTSSRPTGVSSSTS